MRGQGIFKKFWPRGGGEGYFADDERGWGATPSPMYSGRVVLCCVVLCCVFMFWRKGYHMSTPKKFFTYSKNSASATLKARQKKNIKFCDTCHKK